MASLRGIYQNVHKSFSSSNPKFLLSFSRGFSSKLFVKGISFSSTEETLSEAFSKFGKVIEAKIIMNKGGTRPKGYAWLTFVREEDAQKALYMNGKVLDGRVLFVDKARPSRSRP